MADPRASKASAEHITKGGASSGDDVGAERRAIDVVRIAAVLSGLEALAALLFGVVEVVSLDPQHPSVGITTGVFLLLYAVGLAFAARGMWTVRRWSRSPIVLAQLIQLGLAWSFAGGSTVWVAVLLAVPAVVVLVIVFLPASTQVLYGRHENEDVISP